MFLVREKKSEAIGNIRVFGLSNWIFDSAISQSSKGYRRSGFVGENPKKSKYWI